MKRMKMISKASSVLLVLFLALQLSSCSKGGGGTPTPAPTPEENVVFAVDIDPGTGIYTALGASQDAKVTLSSKMPPSGITIDVTVKKDSDNSVVFSTSQSSTVSPSTVTISNLSQGVICTATFVVTSKSKPTNTATKSFKIARK